MLGQLLYVTICQQIVDAWAKVQVSSVIQVFIKAGIITEQPNNSNETDSDNDERDSGMLDAKIALTVKLRCSTLKMNNLMDLLQRKEIKK